MDGIISLLFYISKASPSESGEPDFCHEVLPKSLQTRHLARGSTIPTHFHFILFTKSWSYVHPWSLEMGGQGYHPMPGSTSASIDEGLLSSGRPEDRKKVHIHFLPHCRERDSRNAPWVGVTTSASSRRGDPSRSQSVYLSTDKCHLSTATDVSSSLGSIDRYLLSVDSRWFRFQKCRTFSQVRTLRGAHQSRVGSLAWNGCILTTGGGDGLVVSHDHRMSSPTVRMYKGHRLEVCGLKWSASGRRLASGGADRLVHLWDVAMNPRPAYAHRLEDHISRVRALAWCPFKSHLLASGGGEGDNQIRFWDTLTGVCLMSVDTGSQVSGLLWNQQERERELLSAHCSGENTLMLWKYPSMAKIADIRHPIKQLLYMAQSPDNCTVASAGNRKAYFLDIFGDPEAPEEPKKPQDPGLFGRFNHIR
ncbi:hypothetical protein Taro_048932 [Colocasia esculenta]|uniref:CDC20/Fizzy WD40 domain-containing protein n=1 Tax=Colocasia esculenta TaxID=4460 RepID=A0A843X9N9_COLES|nr:hypothetical protein [Colocasia esculenta]